ncbi:MAG: hypothetical protein LBT98_01375 [Puniceicoccales bacterium]|jgi:hypothetical protein|nr:hypothetical protein [Puniceicoccales bacterium]
MGVVFWLVALSIAFGIWFLFHRLLLEFRRISQPLQRLPRALFPGDAAEAAWAAMFHDAVVGSEWYRPVALFPGRGAIGYGALYVIYRVLDEIRPHCVLECGSGESTKMFVQYAEFFGADLTVAEHSPFWLKRCLAQTPAAARYCVAVAGESISVDGKSKSLSYNREQLIGDGTRRYEFIFVDGPPGSPSFSRPQVLDLVPYLAERFVIVMDDYERNGERETIAELAKRLRTAGKDFVQTVFHSQKQVVLLCSPDLEFLTSL